MTSLPPTLPGMEPERCAQVPLVMAVWSLSVIYPDRWRTSLFGLFTRATLIENGTLAGLAAKHGRAVGVQTRVALTDAPRRAATEHWQYPDLAVADSCTWHHASSADENGGRDHARHSASASRRCITLVPDIAVTRFDR